MAAHEIINDNSLLHVSTMGCKEKESARKESLTLPASERERDLCLPYRPGLLSGGTQATKSNIMTLKGRSVVIQLFKVHHFLILNNKDTVVYNLMLLKERDRKGPL